MDLPNELLQLSEGNKSSETQHNLRFPYEIAVQHHQSSNGNTHYQLSDSLFRSQSVSTTHQPYHPYQQHYVPPQEPQPWILTVPQNAGFLCSTEFQPNTQGNMFSAVPPLTVIQPHPTTMSISSATNEVLVNERPVHVKKVRRKRTTPANLKTESSTIRKSNRVFSNKNKKIIQTIQNEIEEETNKKTVKIRNPPKPKSCQASYIFDPVPDPVTIPELRKKCRYCPKYFDTQHSCDLHVKMIHKSSTTHFCKVCSKSFTETETLILHLWRVHSDNKSINYECPFCFSQQNYLFSCKEHIKSLHPSEANTYVFGITLQLETTTKFRCYSCPSVFDTFFKLNEHVSSSHGKLKYDCKVCGILLNTTAYLNDHMQLLHAEHCNIEVEGESDNNQPKKIDIKDLFKCFNCQSYFLTKTFLTVHQKAVHVKPRSEEKHKLKYKCNACGTFFWTESRMIKHYTSCKARTDLNCYWCTDVFSTEDAREKHFNEHHSGQKLIPREILYRPYKCELCHQNHLSTSALRLHFYSKHTEMIEKFNQVYPNKSHNVSTICTTSKQQINSGASKSPEIDLCYDRSSADKNISNNSDASRRTGAKDNNDKIVSEAQTTINEDSSAKIHTVINTCPVCEKSFSGEEFHAYHKSYEGLSRRHCEICNRFFHCRTVMLKHQQRAHGEEVKGPQLPPPVASSSSSSSEVTFSCSVCYAVSTATEFHKHHSTFELEALKLYCQFCNKIFFYKNSLKRHIQREHLNNKPKRMNVPISIQEQGIQPSISLAGANELLTSESGIGSLVVHTCNECLLNFKTPEFLSQHISMKHGGNSNVIRPCCKICNKTFSDMSGFHRHRKYLHEVVSKKYFCPQCPMKFKLPQHLKAHASKIHGSNQSKAHIPRPVIESKQFKCKFCRKEFALKKNFKKHLNKVHFPQLCETFCDYCGLQISQKRKCLENHIRLEHPGQKVVMPESNTNHNPPTVNKPIATKVSLSELVELVKEINEQTKSTASQKRSNSKICKSRRRKRRTKKRKKSSDSEHISGQDYSAEENGTFSNESTTDESDEGWISDVEHNFFMMGTSESENENPISSKEIIGKDKKDKQTTTNKSSKTKFFVQNDLSDSDQSSITTNITSRSKPNTKGKFLSPLRNIDDIDSDADYIPDESDEEEFIPPTKIIQKKSNRKSKRKSLRLTNLGDDDGSDYNSEKDSSDSLPQYPPKSRGNRKIRSRRSSETASEAYSENHNTFGKIKLPVLVLHRCDYMLKK